jgi:cytochrome o ubiquinol oxidase subunit 1
VLAAISVALSFGLIWYMWWLAALGFAALFAVAVGHTFNYDRSFHIPAARVARTESERTRRRAQEA